MTALTSQATAKRLALPTALVGASVAVGMGASMNPPLSSGSSLGPIFASSLISTVIVAWALVRFGHRTVASLALYGGALTLALQTVRVTEWMTMSDLFLLAAGVLLLPEASQLRFLSPLQRGFAWAVMLIVAGGLLGTFVAEETNLSLLNLVRLAVAAGATLVVFALWAPSAVELRRFLILVLVSGLVTAVWAVTHATSDFVRPSGFSGHPNHLALLCLIALGPAIALSFFRSARRIPRVAAGGATALLVGGIVVSGSRAGLIGLAALVVLTAALSPNFGTRVQFAIGATTIAFASVAGFGALTPENAISRTFNTETVSSRKSNQGHREALSEMAEQIQRKPITGVGFSDPLAGHDAYLQLWAAGGILACLGGLFLIGATGRTVVQLRRRVPLWTTHDRWWPLLASTISLSGLVVALAFQNALWNRYIWITVALVATSSALAGSRHGGEAFADVSAREKRAA